MNEDEISIIWCVDDVLVVRPGLTHDEAREVLHEAKRRHDASIGICWVVLETHADMMFPNSLANEGDLD